MRLAIVYAIIALIATAANLGPQALSVRLWTGLWHIGIQDKSLRYLGGLIGLVLGYWAKYHLDKRFVFRVAAP